jgi:hypothetical protein
MKKNFSIYFSFIIFILTHCISFAQNVTLNYPKNGFITDQASIELCWNYQIGQLYEVEVAFTQNFNPISFTANNLASGKINIPTQNTNSTYFWRVRRTSPQVSAWSNSSSFIYFSPSAINNLSLWLKADTGLILNNNNLLTWKDLSVNQYSFTQPTALYQPLPIQNFCTNKKAVKFDGNDFFEFPNFTYGSSNTVFIVGKKNAGSIYGRYIGAYSYNMEVSTDFVAFLGYPNNIFVTFNSTTPSLMTLTRTPSAVSFMVNDSTIGEENINLSATTNGTFFVGKSVVNDFLNGEIAEIILSTTLLNDSSISLVN